MTPPAITEDGGDGAVVVDTEPADQTSDHPWRRLDARMIWVDLLQIAVSLMPTAIAVFVFGVEAGEGTLWPVIGIAVYGIVGALSDALRWVVTRYRVTDQYVERRTGLLVRQYRSIRRDRIRSVDSRAKLRHRLAGLRPVKVGAGQQSPTGESALELDAVSRATADELRHELLYRRGHAGRARSDTGDGEAVAPAEATTGGPPAATADRDAASEIAGTAGSGASRQVFARIRWSWIVYNVFNVWAYLMALGLLWGANWLLGTFGINLSQAIADAFDWESLGVMWSVIIGVLAVGALGVVGLAVHFVTTNWSFELARVPSDGGTVLRTTQGLFTTREVNRDDNRLRGISISEPLLWRWMGVADTTVITTGLSLWNEAATIIPRGPVRVARRVAASVLEVEDDRSPFTETLRRHPRTALRRRLLWATLVTAAVGGVLAWLGATTPMPSSVAWITTAVLLPLMLSLAYATYRALGHAISGDYVVIRAGLMAWATSALQRKAVSGVSLSQSVLQRRLGLVTVAVNTAAGWGAYDAPDVDQRDAVAFADEASLGLLSPYIERVERGERSDRQPVDAVSAS